MFYYLSESINLLVEFKLYKLLSHEIRYISSKI